MFLSKSLFSPSFLPYRGKKNRLRRSGIEPLGAKTCNNWAKNTWKSISRTLLDDTEIIIHGWSNKLTCPFGLSDLSSCRNFLPPWVRAQRSRIFCPIGHSFLSFWVCSYIKSLFFHFLGLFLSKSLIFPNLGVVLKWSSLFLPPPCTCILISSLREKKWSAIGSHISSI